MQHITNNHAILSDIDLSLLPSTSTDIAPWQQDLVRRIEDKLSGAFAMITGRGIQSVDTVFPGIAASVEQHAAWRPARGQQLTALGKQADINDIVREAAAALNGNVRTVATIAELATEANAIYIEPKQFSLALVFTHAVDQATKDATLAAAKSIMAGLPGLSQTHGIKIGSDSIEIGPQGVDKGVAVRDFMATSVFAGRTPIYIGDGPTDEAAMHAVRAYGGYNIAVGDLIRDENIVDLRVKGINDVWDVLKRWDAGLAP